MYQVLSLTDGHIQKLIKQEKLKHYYFTEKPISLDVKKMEGEEKGRIS